MEIYSDGGSRGNPGPAACAFVVIDDGKVIFKNSKYLETATNNFAEYSGAIEALTWLSNSKYLNQDLPITFYMDSELVVKQINGEYKIKDETLKKLILIIRNLLSKIKTKIIFKSVPREKNKLADFLVNKQLDSKLFGQGRV